MKKEFTLNTAVNTAKKLGVNVLEGTKQINASADWSLAACGVVSYLTSKCGFITFKQVKK